MSVYLQSHKNYLYIFRYKIIFLFFDVITVNGLFLTSVNKLISDQTSNERIWKLFSIPNYVLARSRDFVHIEMFILYHFIWYQNIVLLLFIPGTFFITTAPIGHGVKLYSLFYSFTRWIGWAIQHYNIKRIFTFNS